MKPLLIAILYFVAVIILAHFFAPPGYVWTHNTISDLASQGHVHKWIMQAGFIGFGLLLTAGLVWKSYALGRYPLSQTCQFSCMVCPFWLPDFSLCRAADSAIVFSENEAQIHSLFAMIGGFALIAGILWYLIVSPGKKRTVQLQCSSF